jgi:hypothetical protein
MSNNNNKKIVPNQFRSSKSIIMVPNTQTLLDQALSMVGMELARLQKSSDENGGLDTFQAKSLTQYIKCIVDVQKENREHDKHNEGADDLTAEEMLQHIKKIAAAEKNTPLIMAINQALNDVNSKKL